MKSAKFEINKYTIKTLKDVLELTSLGGNVGDRHSRKQKLRRLIKSMQKKLDEDPNIRAKVLDFQKKFGVRNGN